MNEKKVRIFYHNLTFSENGLYLTTQVNRTSLAINEEVLYEILRVLVEGIRSLGNDKIFAKFLTIYGNLDDMNIKNVSKKDLKGEYQLFFELVNKILLFCSEKRTTVTSLDLFLMEVLDKYQKVNLSAIVIEYMNYFNDGKGWKT